MWHWWRQLGASLLHAGGYPPPIHGGYGVAVPYGGYASSISIVAGGVSTPSVPAELAVEGGSVVGGGTSTWALMPAWTLFSMVLPSWTMLADRPACTAFTIRVVRPVIPVPPAPVVVVVVVVVVLAEVAVEAVEVILLILFLIVFLCQL